MCHLHPVSGRPCGKKPYILPAIPSIKCRQINILYCRVICVTPGIWVAVLSFMGTLAGSAAGILASARLVNYRIGQLEKKVDRHNHFAERIPLLEERIKILSEKAEHTERKDVYE